MSGFAVVKATSTSPGVFVWSVQVALHLWQMLTFLLKLRFVDTWSIFQTASNISHSCSYSFIILLFSLKTQAHFRYQGWYSVAPELSSLSRNTKVDWSQKWQNISSMVHLGKKKLTMPLNCSQVLGQNDILITQYAGSLYNWTCYYRWVYNDICLWVGKAILVLAPSSWYNKWTHEAENVLRLETLLYLKKNPKNFKKWIWIKAKSH